MPLIDWDDKFCVGIEEIDEHAKQFVSLLNLLKEDSAGGVSVVRRNTLLTALTSFCLFHFEYEERLMGKIGFPGADIHREDHAAFYARVTTSWELCQEEDDDFLEYMGRWAHRHFEVLHAELRLFAETCPNVAGGA